MTGSACAGERLAVWFEGPRQVALRRDPVPEPQAGEALVRTLVSAISTGSELAAYRGRLGPDLPRDETLGAHRDGSFRFPFPYGYASVGRLDALGPQPPAGSPAIGSRVFGFVPHQSAFCAAVSELLPVPEAIPDERAALFPYLETAVNLLLDGAPRIGERVVVMGQGVLGLALTALLARYPLGGLIVAEPRPGRRRRALEFGAEHAVAPEEAADLARRVFPGGAEVVFEVSGSRAALDLAIGAAARDGRVIAGSWLAGAPTPLDLGGWFHRGRVRIISSQVSHLPSLGPLWTVARRRAVAWKLLGGVPLETLVTHRFPLGEAGAAYARLDAGEALAALLVSSAPD
jgi:2-desacetyl-2-hydroxyethyl bacteriochlorophyllide A dehydrogenase